MHYSRVRVHGDPHRIGRVVYGTAEERFWPKVDVSGVCWEWTAGKNVDGYGKFNLAGDEATCVLAHRWLYEHRVGPVPEGMELDHLCRNRACVNPDHLEPVAHVENVLRGVSQWALNAAKTHCVKGHPYTPENTARQANGGRRCRTCQREWSRAHKARKKVSA
jgi:hypothetical protein